MFIDKNSKRLIIYLATHEPTLSNGHTIYAVSSLASTIGKLNSPDRALQVFAYLEKLKADGFIHDFKFIKSAGVEITRSVQLEFWKKYLWHRRIKDYIMPAVVSFIVAALVCFLEHAVF